MQVYFEGLGNRNPNTDHEQIIWYFEQMEKSVSKATATKYFLDLKEQYCNRLLKCEAYELLDYINKRASDAKMKKREAARKRAKSIAEKEFEEMKKGNDLWKAKRELISQIGLN